MQDVTIITEHTASMVARIAREQVQREQFFEAVEREKTRIRAAKWWHKFVPFSITITMRNKKS